MDLLGREQQIGQVLARLASRRLVTVTGPGGIGKTALAKAAHERAAADFELGGARVDLTVVDAPALVPGTIAAQLGFSTFEALVGSPTEQPVLLLIDNCEHVLTAAADAVGKLLTACRAPTVLATSRSPLGLAEESLILLGPLPIPSDADTASDRHRADDADAAALRLLEERVCDAGVELVDEWRPALVRLCRELDGVPLALEIAAARLRTMSPEEMLHRLGGGVEVLTRSNYRGAQRHRSVVETVRWSYDLLPPHEAEGFERLGLLAGPFSSSLAGAVAGTADAADTDDLLRALVDASLLNVEARQSTTWYRMLIPVRAFARAQHDLHGGTVSTLEALTDHVVGQVVDLDGTNWTGWVGAQVEDLLALYQNIATALRWCLQHDESPERAALLCSVLWDVINRVHADDIAVLAEETLTRWPDLTLPGMADVAAVLATARHLEGDTTGARDLAERTLSVAETGRVAPVILPRLLALCAHARGDAAEAIRLLEQATCAAYVHGLAGMRMDCQTLHASLLADLGDGEGALAELAQVQQEARTAGADLNSCWALTTEGYVRLRTDPASARPAIEAALEQARRIRSPAAVIAGLRSVAMTELGAEADLDAAATLLALTDEPLARGALRANIRMLLDLSAVVLCRLDQPAWADIAATSRASPATSLLLSVGHELFPLPEAPDAAAGQVLSRSDAVELVRRALAAAIAPEAGFAGAAKTQPKHETSADEAVRNPVAAEASAQPEALFADRGDGWEIHYAGRTVHARASKGLTDLAWLIRHPHHEVHCLDLVGAAVQQGSPGEALDVEARRSLEQRLRDLQAEIDEAENNCDTGLAERAQTEFDVLLAHLTSALGLGGRSRRTAGTAERARSATTQRIRAAIRRLDALHPELGRHLEASITTGTFCSYRPEHPVPWEA